MSNATLARNGKRASTRQPSGFSTTIDGRRISISVELVGPEEAEHFLAKNTRNRNLKPRQIAQIAADIRNDDFKFNGDTICESSDGVLLDGQNRCHGIIAAGRAVPCIVVRGLDPRSQDEMDTGVRRSFSDVLTLRGEKSTANLAALTRRVGAWESGARRDLMQWTTSHSNLSRILEAHPELKDFVQPARRVADSIGINASNIGMLMWVFYGIDPEDAAFFFDRLDDGQGLVKGDPIFELRRTLSHDRGTRGGNARAIRDIVFVIKAWNAYRAGETVSLYRWKPGGAKPESFPEPS